MTETSKITAKWSERIILNLPNHVLRKISKGRQAHMLKDSRWYQLIPNGKIAVSIAGKKYRVGEDQAKQLKKMIEGDK